MKPVLILLLTALPLAAQMSDPNQPADNPAPSSDASATNAAPAAPAPAGSSAVPFNPAENEPVIQAPPVSDTSTNDAPMDEAHVIHAPPAPNTPDVSSGIPDGAPPALSPDPFTDPLIVQVVARYQKAWDGDKKEAKSLTADLERWMKDEPNNYLLMAYLGSAYALDSRDSWIGPGKLSYLKKGDVALDTAVKSDPTNPAIRLLRAMNYYELPAMFGKHRAAHDDFAFLIEQLHGALPMPYALTNDTKQAIYYYAGLSDIQFDDQAGAKDAWQTGLALAPQSPLGVKIQAELSKLK
jgi:hypothetical protein